MKLEIIKIDKIDRTDDLFYVNHYIPPIFNWIPANLPFNPIWVQEIKDGFRIIDGFNIIKTIAKTNNSMVEIPSMVFSNNISPLELLKMRIQKRISENNLPLISLSQIIARFGKNFNLDDQCFFEMYKSYGLENPKNAHKILQKALFSINIIKKFTSLYHLKFKELSYLAQLESDELKLLATILNGLCLSGNKLNKIIKLLDEIKRGQGKTMNDIFYYDKGTWENNDSSPGVKYKRISNHLSRIRYPKITQYQKRWNELTKKLNLGEIKIVDDPTFEMDALTLVLKINNIESAREQAKILNMLSYDENFSNLFEQI